MTRNAAAGEAGLSNDEGMTKQQVRRRPAHSDPPEPDRTSSFGIPSSFVIRNSSLEQVPHLDSLRLEVLGVVRIRFAPNRHLLDHLNSVTFQTDHLLRIVREETELPHTEVVENLSTDAIITQVAGEAEAGVRLDRVEPFLLQFVGMYLRRQTDAAPFLPHVNQHPAGFADLF